jgi:hypothetical protein
MVLRCPKETGPLPVLVTHYLSACTSAPTVLALCARICHLKLESSLVGSAAYQLESHRHRHRHRVVYLNSCGTWVTTAHSQQHFDTGTVFT